MVGSSGWAGGATGATGPAPVGYNGGVSQGVSAGDQVADDVLAPLAGLVVVDRTPIELGMTGRILADLGATVLRTDEGAAHDVDRRWRRGSRVWRAGTATAEGDPGELMARADLVIEAPLPGERLDPPAPAGTTVVRITAFGAAGPRAGRGASDLGVAAASGNLWATGDADRPPVRCSAPLALVHLGAEAALAALVAVAAAEPVTVDVSMAETMEGACLGTPADRGSKGERGQRSGAVIGITREIWPCRDGWVSFGLRGGPARAPSLARLASMAAARGDDRLHGVDWATYLPLNAEPELLASLTSAMADLFATLTVAELDQLSAEGVLVAPILDAPGVAAQEQLAARRFLTGVEGAPHAPRSFGAVRSPGGEWAFLGPGRGADSGGAPAGPWAAPRAGDGGPFAGTYVVEMGAGVAGPAVGRYLAEQGATVVRVESATRPDFLRIYALRPDNPHGLEGSTLFAMTNAGKLGVTLNLKTDRGRTLLRDLVATADAVIENFTPGALERLGLGYDDLCSVQPGLVMLSTSFCGQTGPRRGASGFGALGSALSGFNHLTGWPDREPIGPASTITDSLNPRFAATVLAAALLRQRRTGRGGHLDVSQVESALFALSPWLVERLDAGTEWGREGNRSPDAVPHGLFPCAGDDRWIAVAVWHDEQWERLRRLVGAEGPGWDGDRRFTRVDECEALVAAWTAGRTREEAERELVGLGIEAVAVADNCDLVADPTLAARGHFVTLDHPVLGPYRAERCGFRLVPDTGGYQRPGPTFGRDNEEVLLGRLGLDRRDYDQLVAEGVIA